MSLSGLVLRRVTILGMYQVRNVSQRLNEIVTKLNELNIESNSTDKLKLYALYKQATMGNVKSPPPPSEDLVSSMKWSAWKGLEGMESSVAEERYIDIVDRIAKSAATEASSDGDLPPFSNAACEGLVVTKTGGTLTIRLDKPDCLNSLSLEMLRGMTEITNSAASDSTVHHLVVTGSGEYFSTGNDLNNYAKLIRSGRPIEDLAREGATTFKNCMAALIDFPKPAIAFVNGPAVGAACSFLGLFDLIYASDSAIFSTPFTRVGLAPEAVSSLTFPLAMGWPRASELLFTGKKLSAHEAKQAGLISDVFPDSDFESGCIEILSVLRSMQPKSLMYTKSLMRSPVKEALHRANDEECIRLAEMLISEEALAVVKKFFSGKDNKL